MKSEAFPSIVRLPLEVLEVFIDFSSVSTQLSISRVSRLFNSLTLRALYRNISLYSPAVVVACCQTLASNRNAATTVRSFLITYNHYSPALLASYYTIIKKALCSLTNLHTLKLLVNDPHFVTLLNRCNFHSLRHFECYLTPSAPLIDFLNRHPRIYYLQVSPNENTADPLPDDVGNINLPTLVLPRLQYFSGNVQSVPFLSRTNSLRAAILSWNAMETDPDMAFQALQRSCCDGLNLLSCRRRGWNQDLIESISIRLPDLVSLLISNVLLVDEPLSDDYLQAIEACLPRFTQLQRLHIVCIDYFEMGDISSPIDKELSIVTTWGTACPSLAEISLPHSKGLCWYKIAENVWIPDPKHTLGGKWLYETVVLKRHPGWKTIVDNLDDNHPSNSAGIVSGGAYTNTIAVVKRHLDGLIKKEGSVQKSTAHISRTIHEDLPSTNTSPHEENSER
ncbi:hypothetical protein JR316_0011910 [Psilocybe cubensis]|uniref:F-box domain-containing protein n=2 Tax=Psilocybe cubensis TaxID=181762 RepID=A0A8H8CER8_PSICU|nr:hypothetical protein JR316_0011910 [Psilocybe cubensis]KAH9476335.1 hypothetical protein JR316_0011910 [Psilocybe cubensis]